MRYSYVNKKITENKEKVIDNNIENDICAQRSDIFALNIHLVRILKEAKTARREHDWKTFGYKMYQAGEYACKIKMKESLFNITDSSFRIEKLLQEDNRDRGIPEFISRDTIETFPELISLNYYQ